MSSEKAGRQNHYNKTVFMSFGNVRQIAINNHSYMYVYIYIYIYSIYIICNMYMYWIIVLANFSNRNRPSCGTKMMIHGNLSGPTPRPCQSLIERQPQPLDESQVDGYQGSRTWQQTPPDSESPSSSSLTRRVQRAWWSAISEQKSFKCLKYHQVTHSNTVSSTVAKQPRASLSLSWPEPSKSPLARACGTAVVSGAHG